MATSNWLRSSRKARGLSQAALAAEVGTNQAQISQWETGKTTPSDEQASRLRKALGAASEPPRQMAMSFDAASGDEAIPARAAEPQPRPRRGRRAKKTEPEPALVDEPAPGEQLSLAQLERHLWGAADILRGSIDSSDYKHYIFGLLFYKRLCDVWEEEYEDRLAEYEDEELAADPDEHRFYIPEGHFWVDVRGQRLSLIALRLSTSIPGVPFLELSEEWQAIEGRTRGHSQHGFDVLRALVSHSNPSSWYSHGSPGK